MRGRTLWLRWGSLGGPCNAGAPNGAQHADRYGDNTPPASLPSSHGGSLTLFY